MRKKFRHLDEITSDRSALDNVTQHRINVASEYFLKKYNVQRQLGPLPQYLAKLITSEVHSHYLFIAYEMSMISLLLFSVF